MWYEFSSKKLDRMFQTKGHKTTDLSVYLPFLVYVDISRPLPYWYLLFSWWCSKHPFLMALTMTIELWTILGCSAVSIPSWISLLMWYAMLDSEPEDNWNAKITHASSQQTCGLPDETLLNCSPDLRSLAIGWAHHPNQWSRQVSR